MSNEVDNVEQSHEWSRHFDTLFWTVTTIFIGGIAGLLTFLFVNTNYSFPVAMLGLGLVVVSVFFANGFRAARKRAQSLMPNNFRNLIRAQSLRHRQWTPYLLVHFWFALLFAWLIIIRECNSICWWIGILLGGMVALSILAFAIYDLHEWLTERGQIAE